MTSQNHDQPPAPVAGRDYRLPAGSPAANHGKTVAAWTLLWLASLGAVAGALGIIFWQAWLVAVGVAFVVIGVVAAQVLRAMGLGQPVPEEAGGSRDADWYG